MNRIPTAIVLGLLAIGLVPVACGSDNKNDSQVPFVPPGGSGGSFNPGDGGGNSGSGAYGAGGSGATGGQAQDAGEDVEAGPPSCADQYKRCDHVFTYPAGSETSVELRGSYSATGWDTGVPMQKVGSEWTATVPVPWNFTVYYKFVIDGTTWVIDPNNPTKVPDGQGGYKSELDAGTCDWWSCSQDEAPGSCDTASRQCDFKFVYTDHGESSVKVMGDFAADGWTNGVAMTKVGTQWSATVPGLAWGSAIQYKFVLNGTTWITDPGNPNTVSDGYGGQNSVIQDLTCDWWSCAGVVNPNAFDWRDAVLYFVFTDRFKDGNPSNNGSPTGNGVLPPADYQGGDWAGVTAKINDGYFTNLGVNVLWVSPPMDNTSQAGEGVGGDTHMYSGYHGYWPSKLDQPEEHFGTMDDLKAMVNAAHAKNIRVLFDYPMNHVFQDSPVYAQHPDWFNPQCICGQGCSWDGAQGKVCWFAPYLPDFNFDLADPRNFSVSNAEWWIQQTGIDGFRLDAIKQIADQWIYDMRSRVKTDIEPASQQHFYMVGETFTGDRGLIGYYVKPTMLDGQFEFPLRNTIVSAILTRAGSMQSLSDDLGAYETAYSASAIMSTFVGNQDMPRAIHFAQDNPISTNAWYDGKDRAWAGQPALPSGTSAFERLANAFTVLFTIKGVPLIYYGDEVGLPGAGDPDNRRFMQWSNYSAGQTLVRDHISKLAQIRAAHPALRRGTRTTLSVGNDTIVYKMETTGDTVYVAVNRGDSQTQAGGLPSGQLTDLLSNSSVAGPTVTLPARSSMVLIAQ